MNPSKKPIQAFLSLTLFASLLAGCTPQGAQKAAPGAETKNLTSKAAATQALGVPNAAWEGPKVISSGGTYSGNWKSTSSSTDAVVINTTEPVIIENCMVTGPGELIHVPWGGDITIRNCKGYGVRGNTHSNRFAVIGGASRVIIENNYFENTSGITLGDMHAGTSEILVRKNFARNIDCRDSNGAAGMCNFAGLDKVSGVGNIEISWNQVINDPDNSNVEDNINFYKSGGTPGNYAKVHDNYVQGAYPVSAGGPEFSGTGLITDSGGDGAGGVSCYLEAYNNQFVSIGNTVMSIASGHDIKYHDNRIVASGQLQDGRQVTSNFAGMQIANYYPAGEFHDNNMYNQTTAYVTPKYSYSVPTIGRNDWRSDGACAGCGTGITYLPNPITPQTELAEWNRWKQKLIDNGIAISANGSGPGNENLLFSGLISQPSTPTPTPVPGTPTPTPNPTATPSITGPSVSGLVLINSNTDQPQPLTLGGSAVLADNSSFNLAFVGQALNIRADASNAASVHFNLDNGATIHVENVTPYAFASDSNGNYNAWTPSLGAHTLAVTAYDGANASGNAGRSLVVRFNVTNVTATPVPTATPAPTATPTPVPTATPTPAPPSGVVPSIRSITLINSGSNSPQPLDGIAGHSATLSDQSTFDLLKIGTWLNMRAEVTGVGSVKFGFDNNPNYSVDNIAPYSLAGDNAGDYNTMPTSVGPHTIKVTAYSGANATGTAGPTLIIRFNETKGSSVPSVKSLTLMNSGSNAPQPLDGIAGHSSTITEGSGFKLSTVGTWLNMRAEVSGVGSVKFGYDNNLNYSVDNIAPYTIAGDTAGDLNTMGTEIGAHTITMTPYSGANATGTAGPTLVIHFNEY